MQDLIDYAQKNGITLRNHGRCQFCGSNVTHGVIECHDNLHHLSDLLDFNNPLFYETRFLSVDAMALQHCEIHGLWNNHIHLTRLFLIFENNIKWDYSKTPKLSKIINNYKKTKTEFLTPPPPAQRGKLTTSDLLPTSTPDECMTIVKLWAKDVFDSFDNHHKLVSSIADIFLTNYY